MPILGRRRSRGRSSTVRAEPVETGPAARGAGWIIVALRWLIPPAWVAAAVAAAVHLPGIGQLPAATLDVLIPEHGEAVRAERRAAQLFPIGTLPRVVVVARNENGLSTRDQRTIVGEALRLDQDRLPGFPRDSFALPLTNTLRLVPSSRESGTTVVTYLAFPTLANDPVAQETLAARYAQQIAVPGSSVAVTGAIPGRLQESKAIDDSLTWVSLASVCVIALILAIYFGSLLAPLVALAGAGLSYVIAVHLVVWFGRRGGVVIPAEVEPLIVVLLLGIVTDYSVFFLSGLRNRLVNGEKRVPAAKRTTAQFLPIILTAGLLVAGGVATLRVASLHFFQALGPGMAITVVVGLAVSITLIPALLGLFGKWLFWPGMRAGHVVPVPVGAVEPRGLRSISMRVIRLGTHRAVASLIALLCLVVLAAAATGLFRARLAPTPIEDLTAGSGSGLGASLAGTGFAPGIVSPTELVLQKAGVATRTDALGTLESEIRRQPGVAAVVGAGDIPVADRLDVFRTRSGEAARYFVVFDHHPFDAGAIGELRKLQEAMPGLLAQAGLSGTTVGYAGDTAIARDTVDSIYHDMQWVALAAILVNLVLLMAFLRSIVAPLYLVLASALALAASFGLTTYFFQSVLGYEDLTYYVPLAVGVLLVSFGSDYNVFVVGRIWQSASDRPLREAIAYAAPRASRAITVAGITLALSFASLAIVPLRSFREFAFAMAVGVLIDTFLVRSFLIPSLVSAVGERSWWPSRRRRFVSTPDPVPDTEA